MADVLLTGGSGFIGGRLARRLRDEGHRVTLLLRPGRSVPGYDIIDVSTFDAGSIEIALQHRSFDAVINLAAAGVKPDDRDPGRTFDLNVSFARLLLDAAARSGATTFIQAGSSAEYADEAVSPLDRSRPLQSRRLYGASKATATLMVSALGPAMGLNTLTLRLFNVYGPGEAPHRLLPSLVKALAAGERVPLSEGLQERDFIHVDDVCQAFLHALSWASQASGSIVDVCTGQATSVRQFAETVADTIGADRRLLAFGEIAMRPDDLMKTVGNPDPMRSLLNWQPTLTLDAGVRRAVAEMIHKDGQHGQD